MRHALLALAALALCACQPQAPDGEPAPPPADAPEGPSETAPDAPEEPDEPKEFTGDIDARGTEPFWAAEIRADKITLKRPEPEAEVSAPNPGVSDQGGEAVWSTSVDGKAFIVTLVKGEPCSDGMSDLSYPYMAVVTYGPLTYRGCAFKANKGPQGAGD
jgi:uncharacterized membrane protein